MMTQEEIQRIVSLLSSNEIQDIFLGRIGLVGKGDWEPSTSYRRLDFVSYEGRSWVAKKDNSNVVPAVGATWQMLSDKGYMTDEDKEIFKQAVIEASKQEINEFTEEKKTELTNYTAQQETSLKNELDAYTEGKKDEINAKVVEGENNFTKVVDESIEFFEEHVETTKSEFDENATQKTNAFNTNATTKTTEYNTNAETKTNEFNSNVVTKTSEFDTNASKKINEFDEHTKGYDAEIEKINDKLTDIGVVTTESINRLNPDTLQVGKIVSANGVISNNADYTTTDYIEFDENKKLGAFALVNNVIISPAIRRICAYDKDKKFISNLEGWTYSETLQYVTTPQRTKYVVVSATAATFTNFDTVMICEVEDAKPTEIVKYTKPKSRLILEERVEELENIVSQMPSTEAEGTDYKLDNTIDAPVLEVGTKGATWQETFFGTNKSAEDIELGMYNIDGTKGYTSDKKYRCVKTGLLPAGTYAVSYASEHNLTFLRQVDITHGENLNITLIAGGRGFTISEDSVVAFGFRKDDNTEWDLGDKTDDIKFMINAGETILPYEKYVGGTASPNIDYPQPIHNVSGEVKILNRNENLLIPDEFAQKIINTPYKQNMSTYDKKTGILDINMGDGSEIFSEFKENTRYTIFLDLTNTDYSGGINVQIVYTDGTVVALKNTNLPRYVTTSGKTVKSITHIAGNSAGHRYINLFNSGIFEGNISTEDFVKPQSSTATFLLTEGQYLAEGDELKDDGMHHKKKQIVFDSFTGITTLSKGNKAGTLKITDKIQENNYFALCNKAVFDKKREQVEGMFYENANNFVFVGNENDTLDTLNEKYAGATLQYVLAQEEVEPYTPAQQEAYNNLKKLRSYKGGTYVVTSSDDLAPVVKETALLDIKSKLDNLEARLTLVE